MDDRRFIRPVAGIAVPQPSGQHLPAHGRGVAWDSYWQRRLNDGDIEFTTEEAVIAGDAAADIAPIEDVSVEDAPTEEAPAEDKPTEDAPRRGRRSSNEGDAQ